ncbi:hypothetical protein PIB30_087645 [Stylosanthes scabra]|uniref:Uncharacterized protein n=1 Tax=Stylosanthes scabra TaxID=79078 RepID=A0ABU6YTU5_9FABA|nr:hypothetical protein [Stylosanthes scabra]
MPRHGWEGHWLVLWTPRRGGSSLGVVAAGLVRWVTPSREVPPRLGVAVQSLNDKEKKLGRENEETEEETEKQKKKQRRKYIRNRENRSQELPLVSIGHIWTKLQHGPNVTPIGKKEAQHTKPRSRLSHVLA